MGKNENGEGYRIGIIATAETMSQYTYGTVKSIGSRENRRTITKNLYGILREFDEEGVDIIYSEGFFGEAIDTAIMNRLLKSGRPQADSCLRDYQAAGIPEDHFL